MRRFRITRSNVTIHAGDIHEDVATTCRLLKEGYWTAQAGDRVTFVETQPSGARLFTHMSIHEDKVRGGLRIKQEFTSLQPKENVRGQG